MFQNIRNEYSVKTAPLDDPEGLEDLLNSMSADGWDLYTLHEAEMANGKPCYSCIFTREAEDIEEEEDDLVDIADSKTKIEKMYDPSDEPYQMCRQIQRKIKDQQNRIEKVKNLLENTHKEKEHIKLNEELTRGFDELKSLKAKLLDVIEPDKMFEKVNVQKISITLSDELVSLVNLDFEAPLLAETVLLRQKLTEELGYVIPSIHFNHSESLEPNEFMIEVRGVEAIRGFVYPNYRMISPAKSGISRKPKGAIESIDFITNEKVYWLKEDVTKDYWEKGLSAEEAISMALRHVSLKYVGEILDYADINSYIDIVSRKNVYLLESLIPDVLSVGDVRFIFSQLIKERVPLTDLVYIFERLNDFTSEDENDDILEHLRISLARQISKSIADKEGNIFAIKFSDSVINEFEVALLGEEQNIAVDIKFIKRLLKQMREFISKADYPSQPVLVVPTALRKLLSVIFEQFIDIRIIASEEISPEFNLEFIGCAEG